MGNPAWLPVLAQVAPPPSDTFYTVSPHWGWLIALYFFVGGVSGGAAFLAAMLDIFGGEGEQPMARVGYLVAIVALAICAPLLIIDLTQPQRFWHMLWQSESGGIMLKWWSPMSLGVWIITLFGAVLFLSVVGSLAETGRLPRGLAVLSEGPLGNAVAALTGIGGLFLAGYTGSILTGSNRPLWADTTLLGLLFLLSGISAGGAAMLLVGRRWGSRAALGWLGRMDAWSSLLELVVLAVMLVGLGAVAVRVLGNGWGVALLVGTVLLGILVPLAMHWRPRLLGAATVPVAAVLVLTGSLVLRSVIVLASEAV
jgi:protein NrfD